MYVDFRWSNLIWKWNLQCSQERVDCISYCSQFISWWQQDSCVFVVGREKMCNMIRAQSWTTWEGLRPGKFPEGNHVWWNITVEKDLGECAKAERDQAPNYCGFQSYFLPFFFFFAINNYVVSSIHCIHVKNYLDCIYIVYILRAYRVYIPTRMFV